MKAEIWSPDVTHSVIACDPFCKSIPKMLAEKETEWIIKMKS